MLEKQISEISKCLGTTLSTLALAGTLLVTSGCIYKTVNPNTMPPTVPIRVPTLPIERPINYSKLTPEEATLQVQLPSESQDYLDRHFNNQVEWSLLFPLLIPIHQYEGFETNHQDKTGICYDYAIGSAALLADNGYPPLMLYLKNKHNFPHVVHLYREENGLFGAGGNTPMKPVYPTINALVNGLNDKYQNFNFNAYTVFNLDENMKRSEWMENKFNVFKGIPCLSTKFHKVQKN
jgi:hypothetical protein